MPHKGKHPWGNQMEALFPHGKSPLGFPTPNSGRKSIWMKEVGNQN